jgi:hypothetical protein
VVSALHIASTIFFLGVVPIIIIAAMAQTFKGN